MKFSDKYLVASYLEQFSYNGDNVFAVRSYHNCCMCDEQTKFMSVGFGTFFCSEECLDIAWSELYD